MAPHSSTLAWKIPWTEEPGRPQSMGWLRVGPYSATSLWLFTFMHWRRKWQPTPVFLPGESQGRGASWAAVYGVAQSQTWLKRLSSSSSSVCISRVSGSWAVLHLWGILAATSYQPPKAGTLVRGQAGWEEGGQDARAPEPKLMCRSPHPPSGLPGRLGTIT